MIKRVGFIALILLAFQLNAQIEYNRDSIVSSIESRIKLPDIPDFSIDITKFGARGDGLKDCKKAFDKAMKACSKNGGGTIVVPSGNYLINGPIHFASHVELHLEAGSKLVFGSNTEDYPMVLTSWEGTKLYNYSPMIYGFNVEDVAITGKGTIDGEGNGLWSTWKPLEEKGKLLSRDMNHQQLPVKERNFGEGF